MKTLLKNMDNEILHKYNEFRICFINIGLENAAVAAARVVDRPFRSGIKGGYFRRCQLNLCEANYFHDF